MELMSRDEVIDLIGGDWTEEDVSDIEELPPRPAGGMLGDGYAFVATGEVLDEEEDDYVLCVFYSVPKDKIPKSGKFTSKPAWLKPYAYAIE